MQLVITQRGEVRCLYGEEINLTVLGVLEINRASHVEPDEYGQWHADLAPVDGPKLGPFARRSFALQAEREWLHAFGLTSPRVSSSDAP